MPPRPKLPKVRLVKEPVNGLPTWVTVCARCGPVSRNWAHGPARDVLAAHRAKHALLGPDWRGR